MQTLVSGLPLLASALASRVSIGAAVSVFAAGAVEAVSCLASILNPGFAGRTGANIESEIRLTDSSTRQLARTAPMTLFSSKEFMSVHVATDHPLFGGRRHWPKGCARGRLLAHLPTKADPGCSPGAPKG